MGWMTGFEPATSGSTIRRSNQLSYTHHEGLEEGMILTKRGCCRNRCSLLSCIESRLHLRKNGVDGCRRIGCITNGSANHEIIGS